MPMSNSTMTTSMATANIAAPATASTSAAMENAWTAPLPRTYFVAGFRVQHVRDTQGHSSWTCDCAEFARAQRAGIEIGCSHTQRIAAAAELDRLLRTPGLIMPTAGYQDGPGGQEALNRRAAEERESVLVLSGPRGD